MDPTRDDEPWRSKRLVLEPLVEAPAEALFPGFSDRRLDRRAPRSRPTFARAAQISTAEIGPPSASWSLSDLSAKALF
jgi:hypothetical protein